MLLSGVCLGLRVRVRARGRERWGESVSLERFCICTTVATGTTELAGEIKCRALLRGAAFVLSPLLFLKDPWSINNAWTPEHLAR